jgi:hypothetical protein
MQRKGENACNGEREAQEVIRRFSGKKLRVDIFKDYVEPLGPIKGTSQ